MKKSSIILLQIVIVVLGIVSLAWMLWEPHLEGRNVGATTFGIYFKDPFLACAYIASIAFFVALYQSFKVLGYVRQNKTFTQRTVDALRTIKYCTTILVAFVVVGEIWLFAFQRGKDDIAGGVFIGLLLIFVFGIATIAASVLEGTLQHAVDIKSENDLTV